MAENEVDTMQSITQSVTWIYDSNTRTLTISGTGEMDCYSPNINPSPWDQYKSVIEHVVINAGVTSIGDFAFCGCTKLTSVDIPSSVTSIGQRAFASCGSLAEIEIPEGVTTIGWEAFRDCSELTSIEIPSSVTFIFKIDLFNGCSKLNNITVDADNATYDSRNNCNAIIRTSTNELEIGCKNSIIPDTVVSIGLDAFKNCTGLTSIHIPNSVTNIGAGAFQECSGLTSVKIPPSVTSIGEGAFMICNGLTSVEIPGSITEIDNITFYGCSGLISVTLPVSITSIGPGAFRYCSSLTDVNYYGTSSDMQKITIGSDNTVLQNANWNYIQCIHSLVHHPRVEATYTNEGNIEYWTCNICGRYFSDVDGKNEIKKEETIISKKEVPSIEGKFSDVNKDDWFYDSVAFVYARGIMTGQGGTNNFAPAQSLQRQEFANILWRLAGEPSATYEAKFPDVPDGTWFTTPIMWAYKNGVITGYASGNFGVGDNVTREQFATMLYRYAKEIAKVEMTGAADISSYPDAGDVSPWALEAMQWAVGNGIITGKQGVYLDPAGNAARCEGAAMIQRFMEKYGL